jgi:hypothetical protein
MRVVALAGARAGRYELLEELERDGVTAVWLARAARAGSPPVCVVVLDHRVGIQLELRSEFLREARAAQAARHERLLPIEDVGPFGPAAYLCMPWLDAVPLDELLAESTRRGSPMPAGVVLRIALDALEPLAALHAATPPPSSETGTHHPALHGDLTPHSLWLTEQGRCYLASSCVGLAVASLASDDIAARLAFKAPEQLQPGGGRPDARADQFAFGALLWSALAGHRLFVGADSVALVRAVLSAPVPSLADIGVAVPSGVSNVVTRALSRDPDVRFRDLHELSLALRAGSADIIADPAAVADVVSDLGTRRFIAQRKRIRALFGGDLVGEDLPVPSLTGGPTTLQSPLPWPNADRGRVAPVETISAKAPDSKRAAPRGPSFADHDRLVDSTDFVSSSRLASAPISSREIAVLERADAAVDSQDFIEPPVESNDFIERSVDSGDIALIPSSQPKPTLPAGRKPALEVVDTPVGGMPIPSTPVGGQPVADIELAVEPRSSSRMQSGRSPSASQRWPLSEEERRARELPTIPPSRQRRQTTSRAKRSGSWITWFIAAVMLAVVIAFFVRKRSTDAETSAEPTATEEPQSPPPIEQPVAAPPPEPVPAPPPPPPVVETPPPSPSPSPVRTEPTPAPTPKPTAKPAPKPAPVEATAKPTATAPAPKPAPTEAATAPAPKPKAAPKPKPADDRMLEGI